MMASPSGPSVGLFVTCLVDAMRPQIGFAALQLLEEAGCRVEVPPQQTCCGQPAFNSGDDADAAALARQVDRRVRALRLRRAAVRTPARARSGTALPRSFSRTIPPGPRALRRFAAKTHEITSFLVDVLGFVPEGRRARRDAPPTTTAARACASSACSAQPRRLLAAVDGLEMRPLDGNDVCCGFGGTFCVKYPAISNADRRGEGRGDRAHAAPSCCSPATSAA